MRVLQINTVYGTKSTGRTCVEVEKALQIAGYECYTAMEMDIVLDMLIE